MYWNYRILARKEEDCTLSFGIYTVSYDNGKPDGHSVIPSDINEDSIDLLKKELDRMKEAFDLPILWADEKFPQPFINEKYENI